MKQLRNRILLALAGGTAILLAGCSTSPLGPAPVVDHSSYTGGTPSGRYLPGSVQDSGRLHTIAPGDTLYNISVRYGLDPRELAALNGVSDPTQLRIGQVLRLPASVTAPREYIPNPDIRVTRPEDGRAQIRQGVEHSVVQPVVMAGSSETIDTGRGSVVSPAEPAAPEVVAPEPEVKTPPIVPGARMIWPAEGKILAQFGGSSKGVDISGIRGDIVVAAMGGEVIYADSGVPNYGNLVIVKHSPTLVTAYAHNDKIVVKQGDKVRAGQKIAEMGDSGTNRVKLHFEVREKGRPVNPMTYLPKN